MNVSDMRITIQQMQMMAPPSSAFLAMITAELAAIRREVATDLARQVYGEHFDHWEHYVQQAVDAVGVA